MILVRILVAILGLTSVILMMPVAIVIRIIMDIIENESIILTFKVAFREIKCVTIEFMKYIKTGKFDYC